MKLNCDNFRRKRRRKKKKGTSNNKLKFDLLPILFLLTLAPLSKQVALGANSEPEERGNHVITSEGTQSGLAPASSAHRASQPAAALANVTGSGAGVGAPASQTILLAALLVLINLIVILGNILVIIAVYATVKLRSVTNIFIVSLATADLMLGVFVLPYALTIQILDVWIFGKIWCRGWLVTDVWISTASILNLCAISVDRYVAVTRPVKYRSIMTPRKAKTIVAGVWIVSFLICFPPLLQHLNEPSPKLPPQRQPPSSNPEVGLLERSKRNTFDFSAAAAAAGEPFIGSLADQGVMSRARTTTEATIEHHKGGVRLFSSVANKSGDTDVPLIRRLNFVASRPNNDRMEAAAVAMEGPSKMRTNRLSMLLSETSVVHPEVAGQPGVGKRDQLSGESVDAPEIGVAISDGATSSQELARLIRVGRITKPPEGERKSGFAGDKSGGVIHWAITKIDNNSNDQVDGSQQSGLTARPIQRPSDYKKFPGKLTVSGDRRTTQEQFVGQTGNLESQTRRLASPRPVGSASIWQDAVATAAAAAAVVQTNEMDAPIVSSSSSFNNLEGSNLEAPPVGGPAQGGCLGTSRNKSRQGEAGPTEYDHHLIFHCHCARGKGARPNCNGILLIPPAELHPLAVSNSSQVESLLATILGSREEMFAPPVNNNGRDTFWPDNEEPSLELASELLLLLTREEGEPQRQSYIGAPFTIDTQSSKRPIVAPTVQAGKTSRLIGDKDVSPSQIDNNNNNKGAATQVVGASVRPTKPFVSSRQLAAELLSRRGAEPSQTRQAYVVVGRGDDRRVNLQIGRAARTKLSGSGLSDELQLRVRQVDVVSHRVRIKSGKSQSEPEAERKFLIKPDRGIDYECSCYAGGSEPEVETVANFCCCLPPVRPRTNKNQPKIGLSRKVSWPILPANLTKWPAMGELCQASRVPRSQRIRGRQETKGLNHDGQVAYELWLLIGKQLPNKGSSLKGDSLEGDKRDHRVKRQTKASQNERGGLSFAPSEPEVARYAANETTVTPATLSGLEQELPISSSSILKPPPSGASMTTMELSTASLVEQEKGGCALFDDKPYVIYSALGSFYIPMLVMIFFYSRIYLVASRAHKAMERGYMTTKWPVSSRKEPNLINNNNNNNTSSGSVPGSQMLSGLLVGGSGRAQTGNGGLPGRLEPERVTLRIHRRDKNVASPAQTGGHLAPSNPKQPDLSHASNQTSPTQTYLGGASNNKQARQEEKLTSGSKLIQLSLEEHQLQLERVRQSGDNNLDSNPPIFSLCNHTNPGQSEPQVAASEQPLDEQLPEVRPRDHLQTHQLHLHHHHGHHHKHHRHKHHRHQHHHEHKHHRKHHRHRPRAGSGAEGVRERRESISEQQQAALGNEYMFGLGHNRPADSLNSIQITVSHYDDHSENKHHEAIPMIDDCEDPPGDLERSGTCGEFAAAATAAAAGTPRGTHSNASPTSTTTITASTTLIDTPAKCERSRSIDVAWPDRQDREAEVDLRPAISRANKNNINNNNSLASNFARTDRSNSCKPSPTIVVGWLPEATGSADPQANSNLSAGKELGLIKSSPVLAVHDSEGRQLQLEEAGVSPTGAKPQLAEQPSAGSQGSGLSMMASIPNQVRKQSMMLLSTLTTRSSQTLRRLSMVASHPVESLLSRTRSRDDYAGSHSPSNDDDDSEPASKHEGPKRKRKKRTKRRKRSRPTTPGSISATKKTLDDYLMAVAGIDNSSDDSYEYQNFNHDDDDDDDDDEEDVDVDEEEDNDEKGVASGLKASYSLLFKQAHEAGSPLLPAAHVSARPGSVNSGQEVTILRVHENSLEALGPSVTLLKKSASVQPEVIDDNSAKSPRSVKQSESKEEPKVDYQKMLRPSSGLQRKGAYYERATSRNGSSVGNAELINTDLESGSNLTCSVLSSLVGKSIGNVQVKSSLAVDTRATAAEAPIGGQLNLAKGRVGRRRGAKQTSRWHAKRLRAETKAAKTVAIIVGGFIFCWLPFFTAYLSRAIICESPDCVPHSLLSVFIWLGYLNSAINPVIYGLFSADFRHAFKNIVCRCRLRNTDDTIVVSVLVDSIIKSIL